MIPTVMAMRQLPNCPRVRWRSQSPDHWNGNEKQTAFRHPLSMKWEFFHRTAILLLGLDVCDFLSQNKHRGVRGEF